MIMIHCSSIYSRYLSGWRRCRKVGSRSNGRVERREWNCDIIWFSTGFKPWVLRSCEFSVFNGKFHLYSPPSLDSLAYQQLFNASDYRKDPKNHPKTHKFHQKRRGKGNKQLTDVLLSRSARSKFPLAHSAVFVPIVRLRFFCYFLVPSLIYSWGLWIHKLCYVKGSFNFLRLKKSATITFEFKLRCVCAGGANTENLESQFKAKILLLMEIFSVLIWAHCVLMSSLKR